MKDMMSFRRSAYPVLVLFAFVVSTLAFVLASGWLGLGQAKAEPEEPKKPAEPKYTEIKYSADQSSYRWQEDDRILVLTGSVKFVQGDTILLADKVDYQESTNTATASGNLKIYDDQNAITGDACTVSFKDKKGSLTGNVRMVAKPKPKPPQSTGDSKIASQWKDELTITCDAIEYYYKEKRAVVPGAVTIVQKTRTITADSAVYRGGDEVLELAGNVKGKDEKDRHTFSAPKVTISLKEGNEWIEAEKASGSFYVKEEEEETEDASKP